MATLLLNLIWVILLSWHLLAFLPKSLVELHKENVKYMTDFETIKQTFTYVRNSIDRPNRTFFHIIQKENFVNI